MGLKEMWASTGPARLKGWDYVSEGMLFTAGFGAPGSEYIHPEGMRFYKFGDKGMYRTPGGVPRFLQGREAEAVRVRDGKSSKSFAKVLQRSKFNQSLASYGKVGQGAAWAARYSGPLFFGGMSAYFAYKGFKGEMGSRSGFAGAWDSIVLDVSSSAAIARFGPTTSAAKAGLQVTKSAGLFRGLGIGVGSFAMASIGQSIAGTPGALAGGFLGGALAAKGMTHPVAFAAVAGVAAGGYLVSKGAYSLLKTGYRKKQYRKRIDTAGDTSAFMTSGARTMRERSVQAAQRSYLNSRSVLGHESSYMHMPRNYFSTYRQF